MRAVARSGRADRRPHQLPLVAPDGMRFRIPFTRIPYNPTNDGSRETPLARFRTARSLKIVDLTSLPAIPRSFDRENRAKREQIAFLKPRRVLTPVAGQIATIRVGSYGAGGLIPLWHHRERNTVQHRATQSRESPLDMRDLQPRANPCDARPITPFERGTGQLWEAERP